MTIGWAKALTILLILFHRRSLANDIYVQQVGDPLDGNKSTRRANNHPVPYSSGDAYLGGNNKTITVTQQGNNNPAGFWTRW